MNAKEKQALNNKIAKWRGFIVEGDSIYIDGNDHELLNYWESIEANYWAKYCNQERKSGRIYYVGYTPNFCDSMDALIKWATPSLRVWRTDSSNYMTLAYADNSPNNYANASDKSPSLALALAIEKRIDSKEK